MYTKQYKTHTIMDRQWVQKNNKGVNILCICAFHDASVTTKSDQPVSAVVKAGYRNQHYKNNNKKNPPLYLVYLYCVLYPKKELYTCIFCLAYKGKLQNCKPLWASALNQRHTVHSGLL